MTKFLVDSSSWIHFLNRSSLSQHEAVFRLLEDDLCATCGIVVTEVVRGARNPKEAGTIRGYFEDLPFYRQEPGDYFDAADLGLQLRIKGLTVKTTDLLIAQIAVKEKLIILHDDGDFDQMARYLPIRAVRV